MEKEYVALLGLCVDLVKLHVGFENEKSHCSSRGQINSGQKNVSARAGVKDLIAGIENTVSRFSSLPDPEKNCPIVKIIQKHKLDETERAILYFFIGSRFLDLRNANLNYIANFIAGEDSSRCVEITVKYLDPYSKMLKEQIILTPRFPVSEYSLNEHIYQKIMKPLLSESEKNDQKERFADSEGEDEAKEEKTGEGFVKGVPVPMEIYSVLNEYVVGQQNTKVILSTAVYRHYHSILNPDCGLGPTNILMIGPTGVEKTYLVRTLERFTRVPVLYASANDYTETGYVGRSVGDMVWDLYRKAGKNRKKAEQGIIFIDEIDKIAQRGSLFGHNTNRDVSGRSVQEELLDLLESNGPRRFSYGTHLEFGVELDLSRVLFIAAGAFDGLDLVRQERRKKADIGFTQKETFNLPENPDSSFEPIDLENYGLIPELLGRFPIICSLDKLSKEDLVHILTKPKDSIVENYRKFFRSVGVEIEFKENVLEKVAEITQKRGVGARGLRSVLECILRPHFLTLGVNNAGKNRRIIIDEKALQLQPGKDDVNLGNPETKFYA